MPSFYTYNKSVEGKYMFWVDTPNGGKTELLPIEVRGYVSGKLQIWQPFERRVMDSMIKAPLEIFLETDPGNYTEPALNAIKIYFQELAKNC